MSNPLSRSGSLGNLRSVASAAMVTEEKRKAAMAAVRKTLNERPERGMEVSARAPEPAPQLLTRASIMAAEAAAAVAANPKGGRRRKSYRRSRKNRKGSRSRH